MAHITKEELLKIARISNLSLEDNEISALLTQIESVLTYAQRVQEVTRDIDTAQAKNKNVMRSDTVIKTDPEPLLALAPEHEEHFIVVPKIIENK